jgi:predicted nucleic acid-binding Zn finger protein
MTIDDLNARFSRYAEYGPKFTKAVQTVASGSVKEHKFEPSGRTVYTVVGKYRDEFIDPEKPYCSCSNFFFRVRRGHEETCYHLLSFRIASELDSIDRITFDDEEYDGLVLAIMNDVFTTLERLK